MKQYFTSVSHNTIEHNKTVKHNPFPIFNCGGRISPAYFMVKEDSQWYAEYLDGTKNDHGNESDPAYQEYNRLVERGSWIEVDPKTLKQIINIYPEIFDVLINLGGANSEDKSDFVFCHITGDCDEYRFRGYFGFGGKYRRKTNSIDYYSENETQALNELRDIINNRLKEIQNKNK